MAGGRVTPSAAAAATVETANTGRGSSDPSSSGKDVASRVIYIGQLPHGFYEDQLKGMVLVGVAVPHHVQVACPHVQGVGRSALCLFCTQPQQRLLRAAGFFDQFGLVTRLRVSRNKKTGKAKHYAFVEFQSPEVAVIAADAMDNYMMFKQKLKVNVVKSADIHPQLFRGANKKFHAIPMQKLSRERHNRERTAEEDKLRVKKAVAKDRQRQQRIKAAGIDYEYEPLQTLVPALSTHKKFR